MTKITHKALNRRFEQDKWGKGIRRDEVIEPTFKKFCDCSICFKPILVSPGQLIKRDDDGGFSHKKCRKNRKYIPQ